MNGDGNLDFVTGNHRQSGGNKVFVGNGDGTFSQLGSSIDVGYHTPSVALGDLDKDGDLDLILGVSDGNKGISEQPNRIYLYNWWSGFGPLPEPWGRWLMITRLS